MSCLKNLEAFCFLSQGLHPSTSIGCGSGSAIGGPVSSRPGSASIYIPVNALQNLRASMPALATSASVTSLPSVSRSTASLSIAAGKSPGQSFLSSVISSKPFAGLTSGLAPPSSFPGMVTNNSILFCSLFTIKERRKQVRFLQKHSQGLHQLLLTLSWDLHAQCGTPDSVLVAL